jgi:hypothetical protein
MVSRFSLALLSASLFASIASVAEARPFRVDEIPNGTRFDCRNCHNDDDGATNTPFLSDVRSSLMGSPIQEAHVTWGPTLCNIDSDGDGWSNAYELGDDNCVWTQGASPAGPARSNPGDRKSHPPPICHNGKLEEGEDCDANTQLFFDCGDVSAGKGKLVCDFSKCDYDYSGCTEPPGGRVCEDCEESGSEEGCRMATGSASPDGMLALYALAAAVAISRSFARAGERRPRARRPGA